MLHKSSNLARKSKVPPQQAICCSETRSAKRFHANINNATWRNSLGSQPTSHPGMYQVKIGLENHGKNQRTYRTQTDYIKCILRFKTATTTLCFVSKTVVEIPLEMTREARQYLSNLSLFLTQNTWFHLKAGLEENEKRLRRGLHPKHQALNLFSKN